MALSEELLKLQKTYKTGEVVFSEDDLSRDLYVLLRGKVEVLHRGIKLAELETAASFFGEMALLSGQPRTATLRAIEDSQLLQIPPDKLPILMKNMPDLAMRMAKNLANTVTNLNKELISSWESSELSKRLKVEMDENPEGTLSDVLPRLYNEIRQEQHDQQLKVAESYLRSEVFAHPFIDSLKTTLTPFLSSPLKVKIDQTDDFSTLDRVSGVDFTGATSGAFIFMGTDGAMQHIGEQLFGDESKDDMERDALLELSRRIIEKVRQNVPGLHLETSSPEEIEALQMAKDNFLGMKLATDAGFKAWIYLNR
ncbi:MAG: cyclic nucleotide-binding domain-containing protein [Planctomycetes bacterium]|nr:cyclic nucleotide-binding domain-containing protein [Planctomycetota bacterium]